VLIVGRHCGAIDDDNFHGALGGFEQKAELMVGVMVMEVDTGTTDRKPATVPADEAARLLNGWLSDTKTQLISRSQLRVSDGRTSMLKFGNHQPFADTVCASPLTKDLGAGASLEITPHVHRSQELTLHVVVSQDVKPGCLAGPHSGCGALSSMRLSSFTFEPRSHWCVSFAG
jgi:hypothetical protein